MIYCQKDPRGKFYRKCSHERPCDHCVALAQLREVRGVLEACEAVIHPLSNADLIRRIGVLLERQA